MLFPVAGSLKRRRLFESGAERGKINISSGSMYWCHKACNGAYQSDQINYSVFSWQKGPTEKRTENRQRFIWLSCVHGHWMIPWHEIISLKLKCVAAHAQGHCKWSEHPRPMTRAWGRGYLFDWRTVGVNEFQLYLIISNLSSFQFIISILTS